MLLLLVVRRAPDAWSTLIGSRRVPRARTSNGPIRRVEELPPGERIEVGGQIVGTRDSGEQVTFRAIDVADGIVKLDGDHPLAGHTLIF